MPESGRADLLKQSDVPVLGLEQLKVGREQGCGRRIFRGSCCLLTGGAVVVVVGCAGPEAFDVGFKTQHHDDACQIEAFF